MGIERHPGYWLWVGGPVAPGAAAMTFGSVVTVRRRAAGNWRLLAHELEHVRQYRDHGTLGFLRRYLRAYVGWRLRGHSHWAAYRRVPFEVEAEWLARRGGAAAAAAGGGVPVRSPER